MPTRRSTRPEPDAPSAGLYVHVPFCRRKCPYCAFHSRPPQPGDFARYEAAVLAHLRMAATSPEVARPRFATIFFGGGTPTLLPTEMLAGLLREVRRVLDIKGPLWEGAVREADWGSASGAACRLDCILAKSSPAASAALPPALRATSLWEGGLMCRYAAEDPEISIEANPGTVDAASLAALRRAGFNRLSLGVQSFHDRELAALGRIHSAAEAKEAMAAARRAGFDNINLDLMYGLPGQSPADWRANLETALSLEPEHLALYELTPEAPSPLFDAVERGETRLPDEDVTLAMLEITKELTRSAGRIRYEISNYARPGRECRHNVNYWENGEYLGLGPGAASHLDGCRTAVPPDLARYHDRALRGQDVYGNRECLAPEAAFRESVVMALRMTRGASAVALRVHFGLDLHTHYGPTLDRLLAQNLLAWRGDNLALTERGLLLANAVMAELV